MKNAHITFGTDGWRAVIGEEFNPDNVTRVAAGIASYLVEGAKEAAARPMTLGPVLVGYDTRRLSPQMARLTAQVLAAHGLEVTVSASPMPTPAVAEAVVRLGYSAGVVITASHNPPKFNGVKFKPWYGGSATEDITGRIESLIPKAPVRVPSRRGWRSLVDRADLTNGYLAYCGRHVDFSALSRFSGSVVIDSMYGATQHLASLVVSLADIGVRELHRVRRPGMGGINPEPIPPYVKLLCDTVKRANLRSGMKKPVVGFAFDGDGDRVGASDEDGEFVNSHRIFALLLDYLAAEKGLRGRVLRTVSTSTLIERVAHHYGLAVEVTPVGFKYLCPGIMQGDVVIAGEESGGIYIHGAIPERDGIMAALRLLELMSVRRYGLKDALEDLHQRFGRLEYGRIDLELVTERADVVREHVGLWDPRTLARVSVTERQTMDGLKLVRVDGSWLMVRPSGTEPVLRLYAEAESEEEVSALLEEGADSLPAGSVAGRTH